MKEIEELSQFCRNLRWLLWRRNPDPASWVRELVHLSRKSISSSRSVGLLRGAEPDPNEVQVLADLNGLEVEELQGVPLYALNHSVLRENLCHLLDALPQGEKERAAEAIGVRPSQLSRWKNQVENPRKENVRKLLRFHGLDPDLDVERLPIFLSLEPLSGYAQKEWVASRVRELPASEIAQIYPALRKLLRYDEKD